MQADLRGPHLPGLSYAPGHLFVWKKVALLRAYRASECAELSVLDTNVREIDVAIDDIRDAVTDLRTALLQVPALAEVPATVWDAAFSLEPFTRHVEALFARAGLGE